MVNTTKIAKFSKFNQLLGIIFQQPYLCKRTFKQITS